MSEIEEEADAPTMNWEPVIEIAIILIRECLAREPSNEAKVVQNVRTLTRRQAMSLGIKGGLRGSLSRAREIRAEAHALSEEDAIEIVEMAKESR